MLNHYQISEAIAIAMGKHLEDIASGLPEGSYNDDSDERVFS